MRSIIGGGKVERNALIKNRRFVFWGNLVLTLLFLILTAYCNYRGKKDAQIFGAFFAAFYALFTLIIGIQIYMVRRGFFRKPRTLM